MTVDRELPTSETFEMQLKGPHSAHPHMHCPSPRPSCDEGMTALTALPRSPLPSITAPRRSPHSQHLCSFSSSLPPSSLLALPSSPSILHCCFTVHQSVFKSLFTSQPHFALCPLPCLLPRQLSLPVSILLCGVGEMSTSPRVVRLMDLAQKAVTSALILTSGYLAVQMGVGYYKSPATTQQYYSTSAQSHQLEP